MDVSMQGRVVLVTGAAQGVGRAVALQVAHSCATALCLVVRQADQGEAVCAEIKALGVDASYAVADLAEDRAVEQVMTRVMTDFGRVDCLVNAAGSTDRASLLEATMAQWDRLFRVNARAPAFLMQHCIADMRRRASGGSIVNVLSMNVHCGAPELAIYAASKAALALLTKNAAQAHRFDRNRVNGINMGWAATPGEIKMQAETLRTDSNWLDQAAADSPFGRLLSADDVARLSVFLLADASLPMTGTLIDQEQWVMGRMS